MKRTKRRKQASSKIKHGEIKRINGMLSEIFRCSLQFCTHMLLFTVFCTSSAVNVQWQAKFPVVFGNVTYLQCNISDTAFNCTNKDRQWIGGPKYEGLCYEDECPTSKKYQVMEQAKCVYTLMIYNFSESDVNCEYTCLYGASKMRRNLTLDEKRFIYVPLERDISQEYEKHDKTIHFRTNISKIYPEPSCVADFNGKNITNDMKISVTKPGFYFATDLQINHNVSSCGVIGVSCKFGGRKISRNFDDCQGGKNSNETSTWIMVGIMVGVVMLVIAMIVLCVICYQRKKQEKRNMDLYLGISMKPLDQDNL